MSLGGGGSDFLKEGDWNAMCWECGRKKKAGDLWKYWQGYWICPQHWNPRQPQDFVRAVKEVITPPWVQPMAGYVFTGPVTVEVATDETGPTFTFTPDFDSTPGDAAVNVTFNTPAGPIGPFPVATTVTDGVEITVTLQPVSGTGTATGQNARYQWALAGTTLTVGPGEDVVIYTEAVNAGLVPEDVTMLIVEVVGPITQLSMGGPWTSLIACTLNISGYVYGYGGTAGNGGDPDGGLGTEGLAAIYLEGVSVSINNTDGYIFGGGGGGGGGGSVGLISDTPSAASYFGSGGGGGGGAGGLSTAGGGLPSPYSYASVDGVAQELTNTLGTISVPLIGQATVTQLATTGNAGGTSGAGTAGQGGEGTITDTGATLTGTGVAGAGGAGGDWGTAGTAGEDATADELINYVGTGGAGGAAGPAIDTGGGTVSWLAGNTTDKVKGGVV